MQNRIFAVMGISVLLSGCVGELTSEAWRGAKTYDIQTITSNDTIRAFGFINTDKQSTTANELVMVGEKYIYRPYIYEKNKYLVDILRTTGLSKPFGFGSSGTHNQHRQEVLISISNETGEFSVSTEPNASYPHFCLNYDIDTSLPTATQQKETAIIKSLGFAHFDSDDMPNSSIRSYYNCDEVLKGRAYTNNVHIERKAQFQTSIPVVVEVDTRTDKISTKGVVKGLALTPISVIGDILLSPLAVVLH